MRKQKERSATAAAADEVKEEEEEDGEEEEEENTAIAGISTPTNAIWSDNCVQCSRVMGISVESHSVWWCACPTWARTSSASALSMTARELVNWVPFASFLFWFLILFFLLFSKRVLCTDCTAIVSFHWDRPTVRSGVCVWASVWQSERVNMHVTIDRETQRTCKQVWFSYAPATWYMRVNKFSNSVFFLSSPHRFSSRVQSSFSRLYRALFLLFIHIFLLLKWT